MWNGSLHMCVQRGASSVCQLVYYFVEKGEIETSVHESNLQYLQDEGTIFLFSLYLACHEGLLRLNEKDETHLLYRIECELEILDSYRNTAIHTKPHSIVTLYTVYWVYTC